MENKDKKIFWERLQTFVKEVKVNDPCSEDEQEMILHVCEIQLSMLKQMKKVDFMDCCNESNLTDLGNYLLSTERAENVSDINKHNVTHADVENWKHKKANH